MAKTVFATNDPLTKEIWDADLFNDIIADIALGNMLSEKGNNVVHVQSDLTKTRGDKITFGLVSNLVGDGVEDDAVLEGNEEGLVPYNYTISLKQYRHGTREAGRLSRQRPMFSIPDVSRERLKVWGSEKIDKLMFAALLANPTKILYRDGVAGTPSGTSVAATAKAALTAANSKLTPEFISAIRTWAKTGGGGQTFRISPIKMEGGEYFVLFVNPAALYDLRINSTFQAAMKDAMERGKTNPLFKNSTAVWDSVIIRESERVPLFTDGGGASVAGCFASLVGMDALCWAWGERVGTVQEDFDYKNQMGWAWHMISRAGKPVFNSKDYASVSVCLAATNIVSI